MDICLTHSERDFSFPIQTFNHHVRGLYFGSNLSVGRYTQVNHLDGNKYSVVFQKSLYLNVYSDYSNPQPLPAHTPVFGRIEVQIRPSSRNVQVTRFQRISPSIVSFTIDLPNVGDGWHLYYEIFTQDILRNCYKNTYSFAVGRRSL